MKALARIRDQLSVGMSAIQCRLYAEELDEIAAAYLHASLASQAAEVTQERRTDNGSSGRILYFLILSIQDDIAKLAQLHKDYIEFVNRCAHAATLGERDQHVLDFSAVLADAKHASARDRRALRHWFGVEAVTERYDTRKARRERHLGFMLERLGVLAAQYLQHVNDDEQAGQLWRKLALETLLTPILSDPKAIHTRTPSFRCLSTALRVLPAAVQRRGVSDSTMRYIYRSALESSQDVWLQCEALTLLQRISPDSLSTALRVRLTKPQSGDDLFVRRHAVSLLGEQLSEHPDLGEVYPVLLRDPSPAVRQLIATSIHSLVDIELAKILTHLLCKDEVSQVRAATLLVLPGLVDKQRYALISRMYELWSAQETDAFVLRVGMHVAVKIHASLLGEYQDSADLWMQMVIENLSRWHTQSTSLANRRYAAQAREQLWLQSQPKLYSLVQKLSLRINRMKDDSRLRLRNKDVPVEEDEFARMLGHLARDDFGFDVESGWRSRRLRRGHHFGFRSWRFLYEFMHPATDKRQAFVHTVGRIFYGRLSIPSAILSELAQTKVPGEPLHMSGEDGWRPYLPLVDELLSALDQPRRNAPVCIYTAEGVTEIWPPRSLLRRLRARIRLTIDFAEFAALRNWREGSQQSTTQYAQALAALGIALKFRAHQYPSKRTSWQPDPAVTRFFPAVIPISVEEWGSRLQEYFFSVYENTVQELLAFLTILGSGLLVRHLLISHWMRQARRNTPLVIGGWGTRGKSGTERLKAALFNALGHSVLSKTTGCEAMFLHAHPYATLREMFLFRPYDKATIWEQVNVLRMARKLKAHVFLWECMGLTPSYIEILQHQWMRDDLSTITNTYPDHEDLQGPAGVNIPQVMTKFIPRNATLITSEEQMLPILRKAAQENNTRFLSIGWLQAGLIAPDILHRFPYEEHPYNIALVEEMARELGIQTDFALKEMADRVVPDLGVLSTSPVALVQGRLLEFINGMSANERFGCMANWRRMGFAEHDSAADPGVWLTTVVNNRSDRVSRSRVFAHMLVNDLMVDRHVLIGTNLDGLQNYIHEAWLEHEAQISFSPDGNTTHDQALEIFAQAAHRMRIPTSVAHIQNELEALLQRVLEKDGQLDGRMYVHEPKRMLEVFSGLEVDIGDLVNHVIQRKTLLGQYQCFVEKIRTSEKLDVTLDGQYRELLYGWFEQKFIVIEDSHASGEQIIGRIVNATPPGMFNRIMGVQNIKGTGLDFVYRWQAWEKCYHACSALCSEDPVRAEQGVKALVMMQDLGLLADQTVRNAIAQVRQTPVVHSEHFQAELKGVEKNLAEAMRRVAVQLQSTKSSGWLQSIVGAMEAMIDAGDAVKRRKLANRIYHALATERISHGQAAQELQQINKRQKGGWLYEKLQRLLQTTVT